MQDTSSGGGNSNLAHVAQGQIMQAAMNSNGAQNMQQQQQQNMQQNMQQQQPPLSMDLASVLAKIQSLEKEKSDMRAQLDSASAKLSKLQESKRAEMEQMMNSTINKWLENLSTTDAGAKEQLKDGLNRLVQSGDESGVWNVIACASSSWVTNVNQIETLTTQLNEYREKERLLSGGTCALCCFYLHLFERKTYQPTCLRGDRHLPVRGEQGCSHSFPGREAQAGRHEPGPRGHVRHARRPVVRVPDHAHGAGRQHGLRCRDPRGRVQGRRGRVRCRADEDVDVMWFFA